MPKQKKAEKEAERVEKRVDKRAERGERRQAEPTAGWWSQSALVC
jgi:hypothetical protein